jgi:putative copper export protein
MSAGVLLLALGGGWGVGLTLAALGFTAPADMLDYLTATAPGRAVTLMWTGALALLAAELAAGAWPAVLGASGLLLWGLAGIGHGATHGDPVRALHALHAAAMSLWLGGVFALWTRRGADGALARRFTPYAVGAVLTLAVTGLLLSQAHLGGVQLLAVSGYGRTLLLKLGLVTLSLLAAATVRRAFTRGQDIRRHLGAEVLMLTLVLGVTAALSVQTPPTHPPAGEHPVQ